MSIQDFISHEKFKNIDKEIQRIEKERYNNGFNLFTVSSYNSYLENFHSDVIALLLNPNERHNQKANFFSLFISFLNEIGVKIDKNDYQNYEVLREKGRIDIWIKDNSSKKSIIIENKINNANDQDRQLERYFEYANNQGFKVDAIIYLTLKGDKKAPITNVTELDEKVINIEAFSQTETNLCVGWLEKCYHSSTQNNDADSSTFIYQYIKLLKHLSQIVMDTEIKNNFYEVVSNEENRKKTKLLSELLNGLEEHRLNLFMQKIGNNYTPFTKTSRYYPYHQLFERYVEDEISYKLDVHFHPEESCLDFWIPQMNAEENERYISEKLNKIGLLEEFSSGGFGGGMYKKFTIEEYGNIAKIDEEIYHFVSQFFEKLRNTIA